MTGVELPLSAGEELATAAWAMVEAAEHMRMKWAETPDGERMGRLWTPLHTAADVLRDRLELVTCEVCRAQLTDCGICISCEIHSDVVYTRGQDR
jgi:hypothetical protein